MPSQALHPADTHQLIRITGARNNNLKNVSVEIPKRRLTVFTGVSGSGKSSLAFGVVAAESQRLINETYSAFVQGFMPHQDRPEVDSIEGLTSAIIVDQERLGSNPRSTVGTATDALPMLRMLFARVGTPNLGSPTAFSFNQASVQATGARKVGDGKVEHVTFSRAGGMCNRCEGLGRTSQIDLTELYDENLTMEDEGFFKVPGFSTSGWSARLYKESGLYPTNVPVKNFTEEQLADFLYKEPTKMKIAGINMTYEGLVPRIQKSMLSKDKEGMQAHIRTFVDRAVTFIACPDCGGTRLSQAALDSKVNGVNIAELCDMQVTDLLAWVREQDIPEVAPLLDALEHLLDSMVTIGLGYIALSRSASSLSGGEAQRAKMVRHLGSPLTDVTYVFDEPTAGLHPHDVAKMNQLLLRLRDRGNTVLVVEHKPETIAIADHIIDMGPAAGSAGGTVVYAGAFEGLQQADTVTSRHFYDRQGLKDAVRPAIGALQVTGATRNNLKNVSVAVPTGVLTTVTGVAGSGKSSLITELLEQQADSEERIIYIDQAPIKGSRRSNPATYTGLLEPIRKAFAKANGVKPALFSANSEGACPECKGTGVIETQLGFMEKSTAVCEACEGKRFSPGVLEYRLGDKNISDVLALSAADALAFFSAKDTKLAAATKILQRLVDVGLGYITLGQPLSTLSGGERQRIKLATHMAEPGGTYIFDEPTTGLHLADIQQFLGLLDQLVDAGTTVICVEHHQAVMAHSDHIIDVGPAAGHDGGTIVFEGTPAELVAAETITGEHLASYLSSEK
ncbi:ATP-binding cassette domain-containing protein [Rothia nasimurium]|uniref:ATP-binding cassette domain-containing protein n=1 Tax=Rothia nasimurium TaxID=85336 RepID=UPI001F275478|nr:excinuclease ABC subunit UvrA [Rothia nasimurium]